MEQHISLFKKSNTYQDILKDKMNGTLSHAYLAVCHDTRFFRDYMIEIAKAIMMNTDEENEDSRIGKLIDKGVYSDLRVIPEKDEKLSVDDITLLIEDTYVKPLENKMKVYVVMAESDMNAPSQNRLLKTFEEPPEGVCIILATNNETSILPTIKSRSRKIVVGQYKEKELVEAYSESLLDREKLKEAISCSYGYAGNLLDFYDDQSKLACKKVCSQILKEMKQSKDVLKFVSSLGKTREELKTFLTIMKNEIMQLVLKRYGEGAPQEYDFYSTESLVAIESMLTEKEKALKFNANVNMTIDSILFSMLEERYKWQRL